MNAFLFYHIFSQLVCTISRIFNWKQTEQKETTKTKECFYCDLSCLNFEYRPAVSSP